jgi:hypothetical protein
LSGAVPTTMVRASPATSSTRLFDLNLEELLVPDLCWKDRAWKKRRVLDGRKIGCVATPFLARKTPIRIP